MALVKNDDSEVVYQKPIGMRWIMGVVALLFLALLIDLIPVFLPNAAYMHNRSPVEIAGRASLLLLLFAGLFPAGIFLYAARPDDLILDLKTGQYRFRRGFPVAAKWQNGSFSDIGCLYTKRCGTKNVMCQMLLGWKQADIGRGFVLGDGRVSQRRDVLLGSVKSMEAAYAQIQPIAARLRLLAEDGSQSERMTLNQRSAWRVQSRALPLLIGGMTLFYLILGIPPLLTIHLLSQRGRTTSGIVVSRRYGQHSTRVDFRYVVNGETYTVSNGVRDTEAEQMRSGDPVMVTYLPEYPHTARIRQALGMEQAILFMVLAFGTFAAGVYKYRRISRREAREINRV